MSYVNERIPNRKNILKINARISYECFRKSKQHFNDLSLCMFY
jgi:hypothetical protein